ncbi:MAG TPA: DUF397 domain-containing protein [Pseudonocardiaceae bacterium]|jgi:hypothetical protein|nr:DUF397 domain-containing protein [Pseudonocardiaceae bacterium]
MLAVPDHAWHKSSRSAGANNCVEVAQMPGWTAVRDSKNKTGTVPIFTGGEWDSFIEGTVARSVHSG